jgi:hypothetical protein
LVLPEEEREKADSDLKLVEEYQTYRPGANADFDLFANEYLNLPIIRLLNA